MRRAIFRSGENFDFDDRDERIVHLAALAGGKLRRVGERTMQIRDVEKNRVVSSRPQEKFSFL